MEAVSIEVLSRSKSLKNITAAALTEGVHGQEEEMRAATRQIDTVYRTNSHHSYVVASF